MDDALKAQLAARFAKLPKVVQDAITSADVEQELRKLSETHKLHLDQWQKLENEVLMALFGVTPVEELQKSIEQHVGTSVEAAGALATDIMRIVFEPIREELERELGAPQARTEDVSDMDRLRQEVLADKPAAISLEGEKPVAWSLEPGAVQNPQLQATSYKLQASPGTPPASPPTEKIARAPASGAYQPGETSSARADVHDDPYREAP